MNVNANFDQRAAVHTAETPWIPSPMAGVDRRMLDRMGDEVARATSMVRYAKGSHFSPHVHTGGEEFLVLEGVFQDEHGDFPAGTYVRNPPSTSHTPRSDDGCVIFVKLWQFDMEDREQFSVDTNGAGYEPVAGQSGVSRLLLCKNNYEEVSTERWDAGAEVILDAPDGFEALVLEGEFTEGGEVFTRHSWLRLPKGSTSTAIAGAEGTKLWIKRHHLASAPQPPKGS